MYSLDIHSGHRNMADTGQVGKYGLYTSFNTKKATRTTKKVDCELQQARESRTTQEP